MKNKTILSCLAGFSLSFVAQAEELRVLIVDGLSNHNSELRVNILRGILAQDPNIEVDISMAPKTAADPAWATWRPHFSKYDVVLSGYNDIGVSGGLRWPTEVEEAFESYIRNGGGFMAFHEANNAFPSWPEYNEIIGLGWRNKNQGDALRIANDESIIEIPSGSGQNTGHGPRSNVVVTRLADNHPIYANLPDQWMAADLEVYRYARGPEAAENVQILTYANEQATGFNFPVEWATEYGEGRAYVATYGHVWHNQTDPAGMRCAAFQTNLLRALYWLGDQTPASQAVPADFPSTNAISLRNFSIDQSPLEIEPTTIGNVFGINENGGYETPASFTSDGWRENLVINETDTYTNTTSETVSLLMDDFCFYAANAGDPVTPFIVKVNGDNDFTVLTVGDAVTSYGSGTVVEHFSQSDKIITLAPGDTIAIGFIDSAAPGFKGNKKGSVAYSNSGDEIYYGGSPTNRSGGNVIVQQTPAVAQHAITSLNRDYYFSISFSQVEHVNPLVAHWTLDQGSGSVVIDEIGGHNGTLIGGVWTPNGVSQGGISFNGGNNKVTIPASSFESISDEITIAMWVKGSENQPLSDTLFRATNASGERVLNIHLPWGNSQVYWDAGNQGTSYDRVNKIADKSLFANNWNHWTFTKNVNSGKMEIYVNGTLFTSENGNTRPINGITTASFGGFSNQGYSGVLDDVRIYNFVLTEEEIVNLAGTSPQRQELLVNGSFEQTAQNPTTWLVLPPSDVTGWSSDGNALEIWRSGFLGVPAADGDQLIELNGISWRQTVTTNPGDTLEWSFYHRGRTANDTMTLSMGAPGNESVVDSFTTSSASWVRYSGTYTVPAGQVSTNFVFTPTDGSSSTNLLDNVSLTAP